MEMELGQCDLIVMGHGGGRLSSFKVNFLTKNHTYTIFSMYKDVRMMSQTVLVAYFDIL